METKMKKITPFLWFDTQAEEAMNLYVSIFKNSKIQTIAPGPDGYATSVSFQLEGQDFIALNAGPEYKFTEAVSFFVDCNTQQEVDELRAVEIGLIGRIGQREDRYQCSHGQRNRIEQRMKIGAPVDPVRALIHEQSDGEPQ